MMGNELDESSSSSSPNSQIMETLSLSVTISPPQITTTTTNPETTLPQKQKPTLNSFLDPPSYADAMFRSFDLDDYINNTNPSPSQSNGHDLTPSTSPTQTSPYIHITVSDPQKVGPTTQPSNSLVSGSYYTYLITTRTNFSNFTKQEFSVRRRFREVVALSERLAEGYRGYFIPIRPDKAVMDGQMMQKEDFVEQRRVGVEKYLRKLSGHLVIRESEELRVFLEEEGRVVEVVNEGMFEGVVKLPGQLVGDTGVDPKEVVQAAKGGRDLMRLFKELRQAVVNDWSGVKPPVVEEDKEFIEKKAVLSQLENQLVNVSEQAETLVKAQQDIGETMGELGLAFVKLIKFETEETQYESQSKRADDARNVATAAVKASRLYRELNAQTVKHLDKLHDYLGMMLAVDNAFTDRSNALLTVQTLVSEVASLQSRIEKLEVASSKIFGGDRSRMRKIEELQETLKVTEDARSCAAREYERIKENNRSELARLDNERRADFLSMMKGFVVNQAGYAEKMAEVWEMVAQETSGYAKDSSPS